MLIDQDTRQRIWKQTGTDRKEPRPYERKLFQSFLQKLALRHFHAECSDIAYGR